MTITMSKEKVLTRLRPTFDRLLIERLPETTQTEGGIIIPEFSVSKPNQGIIRDVGANVTTQALVDARFNSSNKAVYDRNDLYPEQTFNIGDKVMFSQVAGIEITVDGTQFVLLKQDEITAVVTEVSVFTESE